MLRKQKIAELVSMNNHGAPRVDRWTFRETMYSITDCQYCKTLPAVI